MTNETLTAYREAARVAAKLADFYKDFAGLTIGMQMLIGNDIPTLATAVAELCAEVERLRDENDNLAILVRRLCRNHPTESVVNKACDFLNRKGLQGSILRGEGDA